MAERTVRELCGEGVRAAGLTAQERAMLAYAEKRTLTPAQVVSADVASLREAGWTDRAISDITQGAAYFNDIKRVALGLGVAPELGDSSLLSG